MAGVAVYTVSSNTLDLQVAPLVPCKLCLMDCTLVDMYTLWECHCTFCTNCIIEYLTVMIAEGNVCDITCPDGQCTRIGEIKAQEIRTLVDDKQFERYTRIKFLREIEGDPYRTFCPVVGCETVCSLGQGNGTISSSTRPFMCQKCGLTFCLKCKALWHPDLSCDENMNNIENLEDGGIPFNYKVDSNIKRCPSCHVPIERNDGCAQMMCKRCKNVFCWYCLEILNDDFLLRHYDSGPCKNKLGHSRASIAWHRTQVVGIFAGFGLLLLVASPFLLLAAPCILCCKCKSCPCCDEDTDIDALTSS